MAHTWTDVSTGVQASSGAVLQVRDVRKGAGEQLFVHQCTVTSGSVATGDTVRAAVDERFRRRTRANHTATHLLQAALKQVLGDGVAQQGSKVRSYSSTRYRTLQGEWRRLQHSLLWLYSIPC
jgi:alanyl-tRNA synthetase